MAASGRRYRLAWFKTLLNDRQLLLGCPPPAANITRQQFNVSILVRHKPVLKPVLEPFCLCRPVRSKWGAVQFQLLMVVANWRCAVYWSVTSHLGSVLKDAKKPMPTPQRFFAVLDLSMAQRYNISD